MKKIIIIVILIVLLGLIIYKSENQNNYGINAYAVKEPNEVGNSYSNLKNDGFVAMQDDWIFYKKFSSTNSIFSKEYLMAKREGDQKVYKVAPDLHGYINVIGDWIVYTSPAFFEEVRLYKTKLDGSQRTKLSDDASVSRVQVVGNWIYYFDSVKHGIYKIALDSSKPRKIFQFSEDVSGDVDFLVDDNRIFFYYPKSGTNSSGYLYSVSLDGKDGKKLNNKVHNLNSIEGGDQKYLYFVDNIDNDGLYRVDKREGGSEDFLIPSVVSVNLDKDYIYYTKQNGYLYKADKDGKNQKLLLKKEIQDLNILGDWIYYTQDYKKIRRIKVDGTNDMPFAD